MSASEEDEIGANMDTAAVEAMYSRLQSEFAAREAAGRRPASGVSLADGQVQVTPGDEERLRRLRKREAEIRQRKSVRSSELQAAVVGHNNSEEQHLHKLLRQWYYEQRYQIEKMTNAQKATYKQLVQLHVDRRRQVRELHQYRQEEARAEVQRERERQQRAKELLRLEQQMQKLRDEEAEERRRYLAKFATKRLRPLSPAAAQQPTAEEQQEKQEQQEQEQEQQEQEQQEQEQQWQEQQIVTLTAKVVEVERKSFQAAREHSRLSREAGGQAPEAPEMRPLERSRSKSFVREVTGLREVASQQQEQQQQQQQQEQAQQQQQDQVEPDASKPPKDDEKPPKKVTIVCAKDDERPLRKLTQVERNRLRAKRKEEEQRQVLKEPYTCYRMSQSGDIEPLEYKPAAFPTAEPTNREVYDHHKRLERERQSYTLSMQRLGQHTATMVNENIHLASIWEPPKPKKADGPPKELRLGPSNWMQVFVHADVPEDVDPGSFEAMKYVEYLRPDPPRDDRIDLHQVFDP